LLRECLNAFQHIYQKFGPLHINSELIGVNSENKIRVWVNENWALNHPSHQIVKLTTASGEIPPELRDEREMVMNLLQVIEEKTENGRFPQQFGEGAYASGVNFWEAKKYVAKFIQEDYRDYVPDIIKRSRVFASQQQIYIYNSTINNQERPNISQLRQQDNNKGGNIINGPIVQGNHVRIV
jgi:hypothetical protein